MLEKIKKNKFIIIFIAILVAILIFSEISGSRLQKNPTTSPSPASSPGTGKTQTQNSFQEPSYSKPPVNSNGEVDENSPDVLAAISEKEKIAGKLPIYIEGFKTLAGVTTTLNVYTIPEDPDYLIHVEIYGIDYSDPNLNQEGNQNAKAFIESFNKIKELLSEKGADITNIYFMFGAKPYIQSAADSLIKEYNLL